MPSSGAGREQGRGGPSARCRGGTPGEKGKEEENKESAQGAGPRGGLTGVGAHLPHAGPLPAPLNRHRAQSRKEFRPQVDQGNDKCPGQKLRPWPFAVGRLRDLNPRSTHSRCVHRWDPAETGDDLRQCEGRRAGALRAGLPARGLRPHDPRFSLAGVSRVSRAGCASGPSRRSRSAPGFDMAAVQPAWPIAPRSMATVVAAALRSVSSSVVRTRSSRSTTAAWSTPMRTGTLCIPASTAAACSAGVTVSACGMRVVMPRPSARSRGG